MDELLTTIKEVQEGGRRIANHYLSHGYVLLAIQGAARSRKYSNTDESHNAQQYYVHRNPVYVLGRPEGVEEAPSPPQREAEVN